MTTTTTIETPVEMAVPGGNAGAAVSARVRDRLVLARTSGLVGTLTVGSLALTVMHLWPMQASMPGRIPWWLLAVCFGLGDGTFALPPLSVPLDSSATALTPIDADGNALPDLLIGEAGLSQARTFLATGTGTFSAGAVIALSTDAVQFVVDDWNFDGIDDVLAVQSTGNVVTLFLGQADRSLASPRSFGVGSVPAAAVGYDLNGTLPTDIVVCSRGQMGLSLLTNLAR